MRSSARNGRVYRRCGCRDPQLKQLGTRCPRLAADTDHGTWTFAVDLPANGNRHTLRRGGFPTEETARTALRRVLEGQDGGFSADPNQTVADYLTAWLQTKALTVKPTTLVRYRDYVTNDLIPNLGRIRLDELSHWHVADFAHAQIAHGRGRVTLYRCLATLSSALGDAVRQDRLPHNPARPSVLPRPASPERRIWTADEAARFLRYCHQADPFLADLFEVLIGTGMRRGEVLGLHWDDVHLDQHVLYVRYTLSAIDNARTVLTAPKTSSSKNWVAISPRVGTALRHRAATQGPIPPGALVFCKLDGQPLRPQRILDRLRQLSAQAGVPTIRVHDLRHLAATLPITAGVPLVTVSKTLRHGTLSTTANIYDHLTRQAAHDAVDTIAAILAAADKNAAHSRWPRWLRPHRDHPTQLPKQPRNVKLPAAAAA
ncbi:tyrosine-type recombinase/integrase [Streptomyces sp. 1331.2]|uniref:tyrosine-type recombinase/integrase n=1 Tax=Streptomyces sp. 1331.2 TaxID=1938835 RepID=UPI000BCD560B|nr:site-specific integrase [Streptomyces sp. 1331.2]SOB81376.1 Site-specific recombinase XerD [Streptomyces sp. 1331.2]